MNKAIGTIVISIFLVGCGLDNSYYLIRNFEKDKEITQTIGSSMLESAIEYRNNVYGTTIDSRKWELIYSGKAGNVIKIVYREYAKDYARPAFSQDIQYDLSETNIIKFKNTTVKVLSATNQEITFIVLDSPSLKFNQGKLSNEDVDRMKGN